MTNTIAKRWVAYMADRETRLVFPLLIDLLKRYPSQVEPFPQRIVSSPRLQTLVNQNGKNHRDGGSEHRDPAAKFFECSPKGNVDDEGQKGKDWDQMRDVYHFIRLYLSTKIDLSLR